MSIIAIISKPKCYYKCFDEIQLLIFKIQKTQKTDWFVMKTCENEISQKQRIQAAIQMIA